LQPRNREAQLALAQAMFAQREFPDAANILETVAKSQPQDPAVYDLLAQTYRELGKSALALQAEARAKALQTRQSVK